MINVSYITDVLYGGVDFSLPGNGGWECVEFLTSKQRVIETVVYETFTLFVFWKMLGRVSIPRELPAYREGTGVGKRLLLVLLCLIFGIEIGFKFATKQVIFLLNPCHVLTAIQVSLISTFFQSWVWALTYISGPWKERLIARQTIARHECQLKITF